MADKRVSVRLGVTGGKQVKSELEGIGDAGERGFRRLSREMEDANRRLEAFARGARTAFSVAAGAVTASLGLIVRSANESARELRTFAQVANTTPETFQRWSGAARTVGIESDKLADILKDVNDRIGDYIQTGGGPMADFFENIAPKVGVTAEQFARLSGPEALQLYVDSLEKAGVSQQEMTYYLEAMASDATNLLPLLRNGGAEMARLGDLAASLGAVLDGEALAALNRSESALQTIGLALKGFGNTIAVAVVPVIEAMAQAFVDHSATIREAMGGAIDFVIENINRMMSYAKAFIGFMVGRWAGAMIAAAFSVRGVAKALVLLRGALVRTGIGALVVAGGELIYRFDQLVTATGSMSEAFTVMGARIAEVWHNTKAAANEAAQGMVEAVTDGMNTIVSGFQGGFDAAAAIWGMLPGVLGEAAVNAANAMIAAINAMLNAAIISINAFFADVNAGLAAIGSEIAIGMTPTVDLGQIENQFAGSGAEAWQVAGEAFSKAFAETHFEAPDLGFTRVAEEARAAAGRARELADATMAASQTTKDLSDTLVDMGGAPTAGVATANTAMNKAGDSLSGAADEAQRLDGAFGAISGCGGGGNIRVNDTGGGGGGGGGSAMQAAQASEEAGGRMEAAAGKAASGWGAVSEALTKYADDAMNWGKGLGDAFTSAFKKAEDALVDFVMTGKLDFKDLADSLMRDITRVAIRSMILGPLAQIMGGAMGGGGGGGMGGMGGGGMGGGGGGMMGGGGMGGGGGGIFGSIFAGPGGGLLAGLFHEGGLVGAPGGDQRLVPALAYAGAPRMHSGGWAGGLRPDEVPAILQRGEMVLSRDQVSGIRGRQAGEHRSPVTVVMNISTPDVGGFRRSQGQIAADAARAMERARRNM